VQPQKMTDFALWVQPVSSNPYAVKCIWCKKLLIWTISDNIGWLV